MLILLYNGIIYIMYTYDILAKVEPYSLVSRLQFFLIEAQG